MSCGGKVRAGRAPTIRWRTCQCIAVSVLMFTCGGRSRDHARKNDGGHSTRSPTEAGLDGTRNNPDAGQQQSTGTGDDTPTATHESGSGHVEGVSSNAATTSQPDSLGTTTSRSGDSSQPNDTGLGSDTSAPSHESGSETSAPGGGAPGGSAPGSSGDTSSTTSEPAPVILPEGCEAQTYSDGQNACFLNTSCTGGSDLTLCSRLPSGRWQCTCEFNHADRSYEIDGAEGVRACAAASQFCLQDSLDLGEETCEPVGESNDDACSLTLSCGRRIGAESGSTVVARLVDVTTSECIRLEDGSFDCECSHQDTKRRHGVDVDSATTACATVAEVCRGASTTPLDGPETCTTDSFTSNDEGCELIETCQKPVATLDEVTITEIEPRGSYCAPVDANTSTCYCSDLHSSFSFQVDAVDSSCETTSSSCRPEVEILPQDEATCTVTSEYASEGDCHADLDCSQPATVDGREVVADGRLLVWCRQAAFDEPWWCSCASDEESAIFEYGAPDAHPEDVCAAAPDVCTDHMHVHLGAYGEFKPVVDPLSAIDGP